MYSLARDFRELTGGQSLSPTGFFPKALKSKISFFKFNQLPPIKEEEGNVSQNEIESRNIPSYSQFLNNGRHEKSFKIDKKMSNSENKRRKMTKEIRAKSEELLQGLPHLVNVNCLMNINMKQEQPIWNTSFGKRLINGRTEILETTTLPGIKKAKENDEKLKKFQCSKFVSSSQSLLNDKNIQLGVGDKVEQPKKKKSEPVRLQKKTRKVKKKEKFKEQKLSEINRENVGYESENDCKVTPLTATLSVSKSLTDSITTSRSSKNQNFLFHCVQNILKGITSQYNCEFCDQIFPTAEKLNSHKIEHERDKQICVLCNKVYYKPKEFVQHLLTHESVDKFSCKKCKKYFPSLKKYKRHCKDVHLMSLRSNEPKIKCSVEGTEKVTRKYECKRCQLEYDSEENFRAHKRNHIKLDLMGAYLLSNKSF